MSSQLIATISGIRGIVGENLSPLSVLKLAQSYGEWLPPGPVVVGRDSRITGEMLKLAAISGLLASGRDVIDIGIAPTPTAGIMVRENSAAGGIVLTASHNPIEWNALKFYYQDGTFLTAEQFGSYYEIFNSAPEPDCERWDGIGELHIGESALDLHIKRVLSVVDTERIKAKGYKVAIDACRGAGSVIGPRMLKSLGCEVIEHDCVPDGRFTRIPEPTPANLQEFGKLVRHSGADIGFALDPDADRLVIVDETGSVLCEELTLALAIDYVLGNTPGPIAVNLASSMVYDDVAKKHGVALHRTKIGEINVTSKMVEIDAVIGGEGNGGVIYPPVQPSRDAMTGMAIILDALSGNGKTIIEWVSEYPQYIIIKDKIPSQRLPLEALGKHIADSFGVNEIDNTDGVKIIGNGFWINMRPSNTEPIIRIVAEAKSEKEAKGYIDFAKALILESC